jgi:hypothetical protein
MTKYDYRDLLAPGWYCPSMYCYAFSRDLNPDLETTGALVLLQRVAELPQDLVVGIGRVEYHGIDYWRSAVRSLA